MCPERAGTCVSVACGPAHLWSAQGLCSSSSTSRREPIGHRPIRKEKGTSAVRTGILEEAMHPFLAYLAAALVMKLPSPGLWSRFVRWLLWGEHAQRYS
jgi:hypothetical protein